MPGGKTSATWPSLTNTAVCDSRTTRRAPILISLSYRGNRQTSVSRLSSSHSTMSMNSPRILSIRPMHPPVGSDAIGAREVARLVAPAARFGPRLAVGANHSRLACDGYPTVGPGSRSRSRANWCPVWTLVSRSYGRAECRASADRHGRAAQPAELLRQFHAHAVGEAERLLDERLDDLRLGDGLDDLALDEDLSLAVAGRDAEVGLACLTRAVDDAAHDGHPQWRGESVERRRHLVRERVHVDLGAPAGRARDDFQAAIAQTERLEDRGADLDLLDRRRGQRDANRVADAAGE